MADESVEAKPVPPGPEELRWLEQGIREVGFFSELGRAQLATVLPYMLIVKYPARYQICEEGQPGDDFYLIYTGRVEITKKGWDKPVTWLAEGDFFGEMSLLFGQPRSATAVTSEPSVLFCLSGENFQRMLKKNPEMARTISRVAEARRRELAHH